MSRKKSVKEVDVKDKRVLMRVDFNVPLDNGLNITDDTITETCWQMNYRPDSAGTSTQGGHDDIRNIPPQRLLASADTERKLIFGGTTSMALWRRGNATDLSNR